MKAEDPGEERAAKTVRSFTITLLPDPSKTLGQSLPPIKLPVRRK
jgi:hypothetical protein